MRTKYRKKPFFKSKNSANIVVVLLICYFIFHSVYGNRGIIAYFSLQSELESKNAQLEALRAERVELENNTRLLRDESLDKDMLDEKIRNTLGLSAPNEKIVRLDLEEEQ